RMGARQVYGFSAAVRKVTPVGRILAQRPRGSSGTHWSERLPGILAVGKRPKGKTHNQEPGGRTRGVRVPLPIHRLRVAREVSRDGCVGEAVELRERCHLSLLSVFCPMRRRTRPFAAHEFGSCRT